MNRTARLKAAGLCTGCGKHPATAGYLSCESCRKIAKDHANRRADAGLCRQCGGAKAEDRSRCPACLLISGYTRKQIKMEVVAHYGGKCACCEEAELAFLAIDHINDDGAAHREKHKITGGLGTYYWLRNNGFPVGFQVLCHNCNMAKQTLGVCPHESARRMLKAV